MSNTRSATPTSKKQAPMPGPRSAAYKRIVAAKKTAAGEQPVPPKAGPKRGKTAPTFSTLKARQRVVERIKREIWASVQEINQAIINLALCGNFGAAKALFDFAGVYHLPSPDEAAESITPREEQSGGEDGTPKMLDEFFKSIGIEPPIDEPEPDVAA